MFLGYTSTAVAVPRLASQRLEKRRVMMLRIIVMVVSAPEAREGSFEVVQDNHHLVMSFNTESQNKGCIEC
jgi:hypothetical protein